MSSKTATMPHGSMSSYVTGFILSLVFTILPYLLVVSESLQGWALILALALFAVAQLLVQLVFFLHMGRKEGSGWNKIAFLFMIMVVVIVVIGSLWIMANLNYNMHPTKTDTYLHREEGF